MTYYYNTKTDQIVSREEYTGKNGVKYHIGMENAEWTHPEFAPLYRQHYQEMAAKLAGGGITMPPFNPRLGAYFAGARNGSLLHFTVRTDGEPVGYCNTWLTLDAHTSEPISREDTVFVLKDHRHGVGAKLVDYGLAELKRRGVKRLHVHAATDPRVVNLWKRRGFKPVGMAMIYEF